MPSVGGRREELSSGRAVWDDFRASLIEVRRELISDVPTAMLMVVEAVL